MADAYAFMIDEANSEGKSGAVSARRTGNISKAEVSMHNKRNDCWIIVEGKVYDVTQFIDQHVGGDSVIFEHAGGDATEQFLKQHHPCVMESLPAQFFKGFLQRSKM
eukprot:TRINITY_DN14591_c1_g1_i2.p1 TRINITY_DN14591_c1_g1~~TRINITY_DN14591_c1_g1_i2.p1  ORF type:complete len:107 (+),score=12.75 TRINITY_DN14591_c1_g1_i2:83-403(+)